jgi:hypothetical protein
MAALTQMRGVSQLELAMAMVMALLLRYVLAEKAFDADGFVIAL